MCSHLIQKKPVVLESPNNAENPPLLGVEALLCAVMLLSCDFLARAEQVVFPLCTPRHWMFSLALPSGNTAFIWWSRNCIGTRALEGRSRTVQNGILQGMPNHGIMAIQNRSTHCLFSFSEESYKTFLHHSLLYYKGPRECKKCQLVIQLEV